jgi:hypothetical protein
MFAEDVELGTGEERKEDEGVKGCEGTGEGQGFELVPQLDFGFVCGS